MQLSVKKDSKGSGEPARPAADAASLAKSARNLADLDDGEESVIDRIELPADLAHRLMEMGFIPGHMVIAVHSAPGGDPRVFRVDGTEIALRLETARHIHLRSR